MVLSNMLTSFARLKWMPSTCGESGLCWKQGVVESPSLMCWAGGTGHAITRGLQL